MLLDEEEAPAEATRRVTRRLATQAADPQLGAEASAAETDLKAPSTSTSRGAKPHAQSNAMHTPADRVHMSAPDSVTPAARAATRAAAATAGVGQPEAAEAASRAGVTPAGKPPLPPTASKAVSAYRSAQRQKEAPTASQGPSVKTRASSPGFAPASSPASLPASSPPAAATAGEASARPVTRGSAQQQQHLTSSPDTEPSSTGRDADTAVPPTTRGRTKKADAKSAADYAVGGCQERGPSSHDRSVVALQAQPADAARLGGGSQKRSAKVALSMLACQGELCWTRV